MKFFTLQEITITLWGNVEELTLYNIDDISAEPVSIKSWGSEKVVVVVAAAAAAAAAAELGNGMWLLAYLIVTAT